MLYSRLVIYYINIFLQFKAQHVEYLKPLGVQVMEAGGMSVHCIGHDNYSIEYRLLYLVDFYSILGWLPISDVFI